MKKEYIVTVDGKVAGRVVGRERLGDITPLVAEESEVFVVYDANAAEVAAEVIEAVPCVRGCIALETSEEDKSMDTVLLIAHSLLEAGASRKALVLAVGGGITTDLAGFAASIYKRGIRYANVPTTLLAQVDAAVGGKTGVNFDDYKNMLGVIVQPFFTFVCADALRTLPRRDFLSGAAELLKTFLIENEDDHYGRAVHWLAEGGAAAELQELALAAAGVKAAIVSRDPFEAGERRKLNLGHTFAHAIEHEALRRGDGHRPRRPALRRAGRVGRPGGPPRGGLRRRRPPHPGPLPGGNPRRCDGQGQKSRGRPRAFRPCGAHRLRPHPRPDRR